MVRGYGRPKPDGADDDISDDENSDEDVDDTMVWKVFFSIITIYIPFICQNYSWFFI